jgi:hypothetical protein
MRSSGRVLCTLALAAALALASLAARAAAVPGCAASSGHATDAKPRPSSFAPHSGPRRHEYGTPIQPQILHRRTPRRMPSTAGAPAPHPAQ